MEFEINSETLDKCLGTRGSLIENTVQDFWNYKTYDMQNNLLSYDDFFKNQLYLNRPAIIKNVANTWEATHKWVLKQEPLPPAPIEYKTIIPDCRSDYYERKNKEKVLLCQDSQLKNQKNDAKKCYGKPNLEYLKEKYGDCAIMAYDCCEKYFNSQKSQEMSLKEYITKYWPKIDLNTQDAQQSNYDFTKTGMCQRSFLYLKDWHLKLQHPDDSFYETPIYFASDWLNEYHTSCLEDDYRFVYMGPKNTWTPFHADVFNSFSWSVNVCGLKKWVFFPPGEENRLREKSGNLPFDVSPHVDKVRCLLLIQEPGEAIFVPSGWYHQVWNLEDTISINHNWVNGCNIEAMWDSLNLNLKKVEKEIEDLQETEDYKEECQVILKSHFGINHKEFFEFLKFIAKKRTKMLNDCDERTIHHGHKMGLNHIKFDLRCLENVLEQLKAFTTKYNAKYEDEVRIVLEEINQNLGNLIYKENT